MTDTHYIQPPTDRGGFAEEVVEQAALATFGNLGWAFLGPQIMGPDGSAPERPSYGDVVELAVRLAAAVERINYSNQEASA